MTKEEFKDAREFLSAGKYKGEGNYTQSKMADLLTKEIRTIQNYETGKTIPAVVVRKVQALIIDATKDALRLMFNNHIETLYAEDAAECREIVFNAAAIIKESF